MKQEKIKTERILSDIGNVGKLPLLPADNRYPDPRVFIL